MFDCYHPSIGEAIRVYVNTVVVIETSTADLAADAFLPTFVL
jgi:hypothetical protein